MAKISGDKEILSAYADDGQDLHTLTARGLTCREDVGRLGG